ncbi:hypothetical protein REPUB_Repub18cG0018600 [Reevesia pubescens]
MCKSLRKSITETLLTIYAANATKLLPMVFLQHCHSLETLRCGGTEVPREELPEVALDDPTVKDIDPKTWSIFFWFTPKAISQTLSNPNELSIAEKFSLAFEERDTRLAPKHANNARQHQRRAEREWMMTASGREGVDDDKYKSQGFSSGLTSNQISRWSKLMVKICLHTALHRN